jgi:DAK2 domain fusion protein YloV
MPATPDTGAGYGATVAIENLSVWAVGDRWLRRSEEVLTSSEAALNQMNVFPVSDADTGSNLALTVRAIAAAGPVCAENLDALAQTAIIGAHGNSGAIVAQMVTSACRALEHRAGPQSSEPPGAVVARLLAGAAVAAREAVAEPVEGTILTVADAAAEAASAAAVTAPGNPLAVAAAGRDAAAEALERTPGQLEVLGRAGVVDAGAAGFVLLAACLVEALGGEPAVARAPGAAAREVADGAGARGPVPPEYEVMYALRGADPAALDTVRATLSAWGHSVVIVGDSSVAQVHIHCSDAGAAVEAALGLGRLSQIRITVLPSDVTPEPTTRTVLAVVAGPGIAAAVHDMGGTPIQAPSAAELLEQLEPALRQACGELIVLPNDMETLELARHLVASVGGGALRNANVRDANVRDAGVRVADVRAPRRRVAVIPTVAQVQGLAAMAVHEPTAGFDAAVVAMSTAAAHTRSGAVTIAESRAMTMAGHCDVGDVLGVVEGDFVEIGNDVVDVAWRVLARMLSSGGELLTLVVGADCDEGIVDALERRVRAAAPGVDVERVRGGQSRYVLLMGVE